MKPLQVFSYAKCGTCRKALQWLDSHGIPFAVTDIVSHPPSKAVLRRVLRESGLPVRKLFNTSGQSYREGRFGARLEDMSETDALAALAADGKLVKRPLVVGEEVVLVGFRSEDYERALSK